MLAGGAIYCGSQRPNGQASSEITGIDSASPTNKLVLVVDDHRLVRSLIVTILEEAGYRVLDASSGAAALGLVGEHGADVGCVIQDLSMPTMSGAETIEAMQRLEPDLPILAMSVHDEAHGRSLLGQGRIAGYIQKPFEPAALVRCVRSIIAVP